MTKETEKKTERIDAKYQMLNELFQKHGYRDYKWIDPQKIIVAQWVRMKCTYGCGGYGQSLLSAEYSHR